MRSFCKSGGKNVARKTQFPSSGKLMRTIMAGLAEFERDLVRDRVKLGLAAARARGAVLGRQDGQRPSDKKAKKVLAQHKAGLSSRR